MKTQNIQKCKCPTCGETHTVSKLEVQIFKGMVDDLFVIWKWCIEKGKSKGIKKNQFSHLLRGDSSTMRFADWRHFDEGMVSGENGYYDFDLLNIGRFFKGERKIPMKIIKDPITKTFEKVDFVAVKEVPNLSTLMDDNQEFIVSYETGNINQASLL